MDKNHAHSHNSEISKARMAKISQFFVFVCRLHETEKSKKLKKAGFIQLSTLHNHSVLRNLFSNAKNREIFDICASDTLKL